MIVENSLRFFIIASNILLTLSFVMAWSQAWWGRILGVQAFELHLALGSSSLLLSLFLNVCIIFYFIGTSVWMKERAQEKAHSNKQRAQSMWDTYKKANKLKAHTYPFCTFALIMGLFAFILGGATQVGAVPGWIHPLLASLLLILSWVGTPFYLKSIRVNCTYLDLVSLEMTK